MTAPATSRWVRVTRSNRCQVCDADSWCSISDDQCVAACMRQREGAYTTKQTTSGECYLHRLRDRDPVTPPPPRNVPVRVRPNWSPMVAERQQATAEKDLRRHAEALGVTAAALRTLGAFTSPKYPRALAFPMCDPTGRIVGIRFRFPDGRKLSAKGGTEGLFLPNVDPVAGGDVLIAEGPTDCAAALDLGFEAIGRPSCGGAVRVTTDWIRWREPARTVVVSDRDEAGARGAASLATTLRTAIGDVRVITPPEGSKDLRAWVRAGATREDLQQLVENAQPLTLVRA